MEDNNKTEENYFFGLEKYGKVEQNEKKEGKYFVKITYGFRPDAFQSKVLFDSILSQIQEKNLVIETFQTDYNLYWLILRPKQ